MGRFAVIALVFVSIVCSSYRLNVASGITKGLIAYFDLTENIGLVHADPFCGSADTMKGNIYFNGRAYYFDGTSDYISCPFNSRYDITNNFSFAVWSKPDNLSKASFSSIFGRQVTAANNSTWALTWELTNDSYSFYTSGATGTNPYSISHMAITDTRWHHVVYTYNGATFTKYLDGVIKGQSTITFSLAASTKPMTFGIGDSGNTPASSMLGQLAIGCMWNRCITPEEVRKIYTEQKPLFQY